MADTTGETAADPAGRRSGRPAAVARAVGGVMLLAAVAGCGDSGAETRQLVDRHRGEMERHVQRIDEFAAKVTQGARSTARLELPPGVKLEFAGWARPGNGVLVHAEHRWKGPSDRLVTAEGEDVVARARQLLEGAGREPVAAEKDIHALLSVRYLGVIEELSSSLPETSLDVKTFAPGRVEFQVHFHDLGDQRDLGRVRCMAGTSETVRTRKGSEAGALKADLVSNADRALAEALRPYR